MEPMIVTVAREMFNAYNEKGGWKTFDGRPVPKWDDLGDEVRGRWIAAAEAARPELAKLEGREHVEIDVTPNDWTSPGGAARAITRAISNQLRVVTLRATPSQLIVRVQPLAGEELDACYQRVWLAIAGAQAEG